MIESLRVLNFKKFDTIELHNLSRVNLFVGINNVGKTTLLEAIFAFCCGYNILPLFSTSIFRRLFGQDKENMNSPYPWIENIWNTFHNKKDVNDFKLSFEGIVDKNKHTISYHYTPGSILADFLPNEMGAFGDAAFLKTTPVDIKNKAQNMGNPVVQLLGEWTTVIDDGKKETSTLVYPYYMMPTVQEEPIILAKMDDILTHRDERENRKIYSFLVRAGLLQTMMDEMNQCFSEMNAEALENVPYPDGSAAPISIRLKNQGVFPLYTLGDGVRRWFHLIGGMLVYKNAVHCIEEVDATFHHQAQKELSYQLCHYAKKYNNQLFITTHSKEYLSSFIKELISRGEEGEAFLKSEVRVVTLRNIKGVVKARVLDGYEAQQALKSGVELRI